MFNKNSVKSLAQVVLIELKDQVLFLPEYFAQQFQNNDEKVAELNSEGIVKYLQFGGKRQNG